MYIRVYTRTYSYSYIDMLHTYINMLHVYVDMLHSYSNMLHSYSDMLLLMRSRTPKTPELLGPSTRIPPRAVGSTAAVRKSLPLRAGLPPLRQTLEPGIATGRDIREIGCSYSSCSPSIFARSWHLPPTCPTWVP